MRSLILRLPGIVSAALLAIAPLQAHSAQDRREVLSFAVDEGLNLNSFLRAGPVAAHLLLRSGSDPRILVAFPAGNSGVGLWFAHVEETATWKMVGKPRPYSAQDGRGRALHGIVADTAIRASALSIKQAVLSNVRVLRDYQALGTFPAQVGTEAVVSGSTVTWARDRLDGAPGYRLSIEVTHGILQHGAFHAGGDGNIGLRITALSGEAPLSPLAGPDLLNGHARPDFAARNALSFLSYREKFLAGSWRFNTYFGRDTLMSVRLLMPALKPVAVEAGLDAVLSRLSALGQVAHEEDIGEFAILDHLHAEGSKSDAPTYNYNMIDGDYMLAPVAGAWLLDDARGRRRAQAFLARWDSRHGEAPRTMGAHLVSNLRRVVDSAAAFADAPLAIHLIGLNKGFMAGQWRDSDEGLGRGRYAYDVNAVFVPAALAVASRLYASGLLDPYLSSGDRALLARATAMAAIWRAKAAPLFTVEVANDPARQQIKSYATALGVVPDAALRSLGNEPVRFHALSLDAQGAQVPVLHSDEGFELLFGDPSPAELDQAISAMLRLFPAGLLTDVGIVVANPVFATTAVQARFSSNAYHGTVIWSWQQAVLAAGLARQMQRRDLPDATRQHLLAAQRQLWRVIEASRTVRNSELWSWAYVDGKFRVAPFGASQADVDESNAAQLWSTVYLGIEPPVGYAR